MESALTASKASPYPPPNVEGLAVKPTAKKAIEVDLVRIGNSTVVADKLNHFDARMQQGVVQS